MQEFLDWFQLSELFPLLVLIFLLSFVGRQIAPASGDAQKRARVVFVVGFLSYGGMDIYLSGLSDVTDTTLMVIRAILAGGIAYGLGSVGFSLAAVATEYAESREKSEPLPRVVVVTTTEPDEPPPVSEPPPPPPTLDERAERARLGYQHRLELIEKANLGQLEETAAMEKAKQVYLRDIDGLIQ